MGDESVIIKPCVVLLEQCTPKQQLALSAELKNAIYERNVLTAKSKKKILTALDELDDDDDFDITRKDRKKFALQEILDSEVTYLKQLEILMKFFIKPLRQRKLISEEDVNVIFGSIKTIYEVNGALLEELKSDLTNVAKAFLKLAPFFKLYSVYACDYNKAIKKLQSLVLAKPAFAKFVENQETRPEVQSKLSALLIAPIQRIPRYCLLLRQVLDNSRRQDSDYHTLKGTLDQLQQAAGHINKLLAEKDNAQRLLEIQKSLYKSKPLIVKPGRTLVKEGFLKRFSPNKEPDDRKYCILLNDIILLCNIKKTNIQSTNSLECELVLPLHKCILKYHASTKIMHITCDDIQLYVYHESSDESEIWYNVLDTTICNYVHDRQTLKKDYSLRKPANRRNLETYSDIGVSPYKHKIRRRTSAFIDDNIDVQTDTHSEDGKGCFATRPSKRKSIRRDASQDETPSKKRKTDLRDSLFPLRYHNKQVKDDITYTVSQELKIHTTESNDVALKPKSDWKIVNMFNNFSRGLKRMFGYD